jgi:hypothetical protein
MVIRGTEQFAINACRNFGIVIPPELKSVIPSTSSDSSSGGGNSDDGLRSGGIRNPHYNRKLLLYLMKYIFSLKCLLDHLLIVLTNSIMDEDTNACSESWNTVRYTLLIKKWLLQS